DPVNNPFGDMLETNELNNATPSPQPLIIDQPPPADLRVDGIRIGPSTGPASTFETGQPLHVEWTVSNHGINAAPHGSWSDAVYLSADAVWDIHDSVLGRVSHLQFYPFNPGDHYDGSLDAVIPSVPPGQYHIIIRTDIFNDVVEGPDEVNNKTASADQVT